MRKRGSGILLHITSLPSPYGIGDFGPEAYRFVDFLARAGQTYWQVLPLNPIDQALGNSPYSSPSAFAGNTLLISPDLLLESGWLTREDLHDFPDLPKAACDFPAARVAKTSLLHRACNRFPSHPDDRRRYEAFCNLHPWLHDFSLFTVLKAQHQGRMWTEWEEGFREREAGVLRRAQDRWHEEIEQEKILQYFFFNQWASLKRHCRERGVHLIGDIPIYVTYDSADVWSDPDLFQLDESKRPRGVAGVPPDYFSQKGQRWGNPIYRWDLHQQTDYAWWFKRIRHNLDLFDVIRLDHFRGFLGYWEIPEAEPTAVNGRWRNGPGDGFFSALLKRFSVDAFIAEDLGVITPDVKEAIHQFGFPGMRILQFAFEGDMATHPYLPHNYIPHCVIYTGTHDNNTVRGWFANEAKPEARKNLARYLGRKVETDEVSRELIRLAMGSIADTVILPMQDVLGLGEEARMNTPSVTRGNWAWRLSPDLPLSDPLEMLLELTTIYGRAL